MSEQPKTCPHLFYLLAIAACKVGHWCNHAGDYHNCIVYKNNYKKDELLMPKPPNFREITNCEECIHAKWQDNEELYKCIKYDLFIQDFNICDDYNAKNKKTIKETT